MFLMVAAIASTVGAQLRKPTPKADLPRAEKFSDDIQGVVSGAVVQTDASGLVRRIRGSVQPASAFSTIDAAAGFLSSNHSVLGLSANLGELIGDRAFSSLGGSHVVYRQAYHGFPVFGTSVGVHFDRQGRIFQVNNDVQPLIEVGPLNYLLSARSAVVHAENATGLTIDPRFRSTATKGVFAVNGVPKAAFRVTVRTILPTHSYEMMVDAATGEVLRQRDLIQRVNGTGSVFDPNPVATSGTANLVYDNTQPAVAAITAQQQTVTLQGLDGSGFLTGTFADTSSSTSISRANSGALTFNFSYLSPNFDETMGYYHVDLTQRYIQSLGFTNINNRQVRMDIDGIVDDNSFYDPTTTELTFGSGGVPDANDADVIRHEYGHSIQDNQVPGFGQSNESGAMGEGFGDYWAFQQSAGVGPQSPAWDVFVFKWDAVAYNPGTPAFLRRMDSTKHYPEDVVNEVHDDGEMWSACLKQVFDLLGRTNANKVILESHFGLSTTATFADGSNSIVAAYDSLFPGGANAAALRNIFVARGFLAASGGVAPASVTTNLSAVVGGNQVTGTVTLAAAAPTGGQVVDLSATPAVDNLNSTVTIPAGSATGTFTFSPKGVNSATSVTISASAAGVTKTKAITVNPARLITLTFAPSNISSGNSTSGVATLNGKAGPAGISLALAGGNSAVHVPATVSVANQASSATFSVTTDIVATTVVTHPTATQTGFAAVQGTLTLNAVTLTNFTTNVSTLVGGNTLTITPRISAAAPVGGVVVTISSNTAGMNQPATVTIPAGSVAASVSFVPSGVNASVLATLTATFKGVALQKQVTVNPASVQSIAFTPSSVVGGSTTSTILTLNGFAGSSGRVVTLSPGSSFLTVPATVTVGAQKKSASFVAQTAGVATNTIINPTANVSGQTPVSGTLTLTPGALSLAYTNVSSIVGGNSMTLGVRITGKAPAGGKVVSLSAASFLNLPASVTIPAGQSVGAVSFTPSGVDADTPTTITAQLGSTSKAVSLTVRKARLLSLTLTPGTALGGNNVTAALKLDGRAGPSGMSANLTSNNSAVLPVSGTISVAAQALTGTVVTASKGVDSPTTVTVNAIAPGQNVSGTVTINPATLLSVVANPASFRGGTSTKIAIKLNGVAGPSGVVVNLSSNDSHLTVPATATIPAGANSVTVTATSTVVTSATVVTVSCTSSAGTGSTSVTINP